MKTKETILENKKIDAKQHAKTAKELFLKAIVNTLSYYRQPDEYTIKKTMKKGVMWVKVVLKSHSSLSVSHDIPTLASAFGVLMNIKYNKDTDSFELTF